MIYVGSQLTVIVTSIELDDHFHPTIVVESGGELYQLNGPLGAPTEAPKPLRLRQAPEAAEAASGAAEAAEAPRIARMATEILPAAPRRVTPWSGYEEIGNHLAMNPDETDRYASMMSLKKRRLVAGVVATMLGEAVKSTDTYVNLVSVEPAPPADAKSGMQWGREHGLGMQMFGEKLNSRLEKEARQSVIVDEGLNGVTQGTAKGNSLTPHHAAEQLQKWKTR